MLLRVPRGIITVDIISINMSITCTSVMKKPGGSLGIFAEPSVPTLRSFRVFSELSVPNSGYLRVSKVPSVPK